MTEFFNPGPSTHGKPEVYLAAVGPLMTKVCAELCDGWMVHPFTTPEYFTEVSLPRLRGYMDNAGRPYVACQVALPAFVVTGADDAEMEAATQFVKGQIGFYGSTPAYKEVLDHHGWGDAQPELNRLTKEDRWAELPSVIDDEMLATFAVVAEPDAVQTGLEERYGATVDRISRYAPL